MFELYIWLKLDSIVELLWCVGISTLILSTIGFVLSMCCMVSFYLDNNDYDSEMDPLRLVTKAKKVRLQCIKVMSVGLSLMILSTIIPNSSQYAIMKIGPAICNSKVVQTDLPELYNLGLEALKVKLSENISKAKVEKNK